jgi:hypothetical protein
MTVSTIDELATMFSSHGVSNVYVKHLSPKQDNEKNQIYLGTGLDGVTNLFPSTIEVRSPSQSSRKRRSNKGKPKLEARINLAWLGGNGDLHAAPNARIIDYFQFPEVRMSGFLKGCEFAPDALRRRYQAEYGKRILILGVTPAGRVIGCVLSERDDPIVRDFPELPVLAAPPIFRVLVIDGPTGALPLDLLKSELSRVIADGWHTSRILKSGSPISQPFRGSQGGGYTLEALLGVPANAKKAPDKYGFEIKTYGSSRISLMTPTPDGGFQGDHSFREFMERYGHPGQKDDGSVRFTGIHRCGTMNARTGMTLQVAGYDPETDSFDHEADRVAVQLVRGLTGEVVASWSLAHLANAWNSKHAFALYVPSRKEKAPSGLGHDASYAFGPTVVVGQGTDVWKLLRAISAGVVFYDPADSIYADGKAKVRPQWRINASRLSKTIAPLYNSVEEVTLGT